MPDITLTPKQSIAWKHLMDTESKEILFGSGAGSGKSFLGCLWVTTMCLKFDRTRFLIGRAVLTQLKLTTLKTLLDAFKTMGLNSEVHYNYNQQTNVIKFYNESEIILKDMASSPSDPQFDSLGSLEITGAFLDEMTQIPQMAYHIIKSRIRFKLNEYNITGKLFMSCNPHQGYLKREFYAPYIENRLDTNKKFVMATAMDNPHLPEQYIETLQNLPNQQRQRLLYGSWDYEQDRNSIFDFDSISQSLFKFAPKNDDMKYMSVDVARFGDDRSVIMIWNGLCLIQCNTFRKLSTVELSNEINNLIRTFGIHPRNVILDSDGVGGGVADIIRGTNFVNNSKPLNEQNFANLKSQCYVKLSELFKEGKISINLMDNAVIDELTQELLAIKLKDVDKDNKITIESKEEMKRSLGKSPDLSDCMMMRMLAEVKTNKNSGKYSISFV